MSDVNTDPVSNPDQTVVRPGRAARIAPLIILLLIVLCLLWYFAADRLTPHSSQARVQAFVVPVAVEVPTGPSEAAPLRCGDSRRSKRAAPGLPRVRAPRASAS